MSYTGIIAERRIWTGADQVELSIAAIKLEDGSTEIETRFVRHDTGRPAVEWRRRIPVSTAYWIGSAVQEVIATAVERLEQDGDREDRDEHIYAEASATSSDGTWVRVVACARYGRPLVRVEWGIGDEIDIVLALPLARALELHSAIIGAAMVALDAQSPQPSSTPRCPTCGSGARSIPSRVRPTRLD